MKGLVNGVDGALALTVGNLLGSLRRALNSGDRKKTLDILQKLEPTKKPRDVKEATAILEKISKSKPENLVDYSARLIVNGIVAGDTVDLFAYVKGLVSAENSSNNK